METQIPGTFFNVSLFAGKTMSCRSVARPDHAWRASAGLRRRSDRAQPFGPTHWALINQGKYTDYAVF